MKYTNLIILLFLSGCASNADWGKYRGELPTLQLPNNNANKFKPKTPHDLLPDPFLVDGVSALLAKMERNPAPYRIDPDIHLVLHQAWDYQHPNVSPAFVTKEEAQEYADGNNTSNGRPTGHKYIVREINHRYEVRHQNDAVNDVIFTSYTLNQSEDYLNTYKANHTDLVIFDLMKQEIVGVNTP